MTVQALGIEFEFDLGVERAREVTLDHHAAETALAPRLDARPELFAPVELERLFAIVLTTGPRKSTAARPVPTARRTSRR